MLFPRISASVFQRAQLTSDVICAQHFKVPQFHKGLGWHGFQLTALSSNLSMCIGTTHFGHHCATMKVGLWSHANVRFGFMCLAFVFMET